MEFDEFSIKLNVIKEFKYVVYYARKYVLRRSYAR